MNQHFQNGVQRAEKDIQNKLQNAGVSFYKVKTDRGMGEVAGKPQVGKLETVYINGVAYNEYVREILGVTRTSSVKDTSDFSSFLGK